MSKEAPPSESANISPSATEARSPKESVDESLALALINTETLHRGKKQDALTSPDALASWWAQMCERYSDQCAVEDAGEAIAWTGDLLDAVKALRGALRALMIHVVERQAVEPADLQPVNAILALGYPALVRTGEGNVEAVMRLRDPGEASVLFPIAASALRLFTGADWRRLHQCKNDRCIVFFYDTTKSGTRRWCSPDCMNRARSIRQYQLSRKAASQE